MTGSDETTSDTNPAPLNPSGWSLTFFDGFGGWHLDRAAWPVLYAGPGANGAYAWSSAQVILHGAGEALVRNQNSPTGWTVGGMGQGWNAQTYGRYEIRARVDAGQGTAAVIGLWPADNSYPPEIDILEAPTRDREVAYFTYHGETGGGQTTGHAIDVTQWHVYAIDWLPGKLVWYVDGVRIVEHTGDIPAEPMTLNLTGFVGTPGDAFTRGGPDATTPFYVDLHVDWVRIWTPDSMLPGSLPATSHGASGSLPEAVRTGVREIAGERFAASWNAGEWGAVPSAAAAPTGWAAGSATHLLYAQYVDLRLDLLAAGGRALDLLAIGAKSGAIGSGHGDDRVIWVAHSDAAGPGNTMTIATRGGDDVVSLTAAGRSDLDQPFGYGARWNHGYDGRYSAAVVSAGPGDDHVAVEDEAALRLHAFGGIGADTLLGGARRDVLNGGPGADVMAGGGRGDLFVLREGDGQDRILDFATGVDDLRLPAALGDSVSWSVTTQGGEGGTLVRYGARGDAVFLVGVTGFGPGDIVFA